MTLRFDKDVPGLVEMDYCLRVRTILCLEVSLVHYFDLDVVEFLPFCEVNCQEDIPLVKCLPVNT